MHQRMHVWRSSTTLQDADGAAGQRQEPLSSFHQCSVFVWPCFVCCWDLLKHGTMARLCGWRMVGFAVLPNQGAAVTSDTVTPVQWHWSANGCNSTHITTDTMAQSCSSGAAMCGHLVLHMGWCNGPTVLFDCASNTYVCWTLTPWGSMQPCKPEQPTGLHTKTTTQCCHVLECWTRLNVGAACATGCLLTRVDTNCTQRTLRC